MIIIVLSSLSFTRHLLELGSNSALSCWQKSHDSTPDLHTLHPSTSHSVNKVKILATYNYGCGLHMLMQTHTKEVATEVLYQQLTTAGIVQVIPLRAIVTSVRVYKTTGAVSHQTLPLCVSVTVKVYNSETCRSTTQQTTLLVVAGESEPDTAVPLFTPPFVRSATTLPKRPKNRSLHIHFHSNFVTGRTPVRYETNQRGRLHCRNFLAYAGIAYSSRNIQSLSQLDKRIYDNWRKVSNEVHKHTPIAHV